ncbi:MAG: hypothetical protein GF355_03340 [Candidatus Eisenbacteria bacterium]|nr:hypothetical protein [Candidatus Eisenbacteria bacterium]
MNGVAIGKAVFRTGLLVILCLSLLPVEGRPADIERIREKSQELAVKVRDARFKAVGEGEKPGLDRAHRDFGYLLGPQKLNEVRGLVEQAADPAEKARRQRTLEFLQHHTIWAYVAPTHDNYRSYLQTASIQAGGNEVTLLDFRHSLRTMEEQNQRRIAYLAARELVTNANVYLRSIELDLQKQTETLELGNYYDFLADYEGWNREEMAALAQQLLDATEEKYRGLLEAMCQKLLDQELRRTRAFDVPILLAQHEFDGAFDEDKLEETFEKAFRKMGIKVDDQRYMRVDLKERDRKDPEAHVFPIENERNTRVTMIPDGGLDDYRNFFRAMGQGQFYYNIDDKLGFENRFLGNPIMPMVFGELAVHLFQEPVWVNEMTDIDDVQMQGFLEATEFLRLYELREAAGNYLYQLKLHKDLKTGGDVYTAQIEAATLIPQTGNEEAFALLSNDRFQSGGILVAAVMEAQLRRHMVEAYGEEWFWKSGAGNYLKSVAGEGFSKSYTDWSEEWGANAFDATMLLQELNGGPLGAGGGLN